MKSTVRAAFDATSCGYSPDRVVADPELNAAFLARCQATGIDRPPTELNRALLNLRKKGELRGLKSKRTTFPQEDQYRFAAEIAARFMERREGVSLDDIICDPVLALEFDELASRIVPGFQPIQYRWAALNLRKGRKLQPEIVARVIPPISVQVVPITELDVANLPQQQGLYLFFTADQVLYVGEAEHLQNRIRKHLDHSDSKGLARWLWDEGPATLYLETQALPLDTSTRERRALETELIRSRNPVFNVKR